MAGSKVLPGSRFASSGSGNTNASTGGREFSSKDSEIRVGLQADPYDSPAEGSAYVRDVTREETAAGTETTDEKQQDGDSPAAGRDDPGKQADSIPTWEEGLAADPGDRQRAYRRHMSVMASKFRQDLMVTAENEMTALSERAKAAYGIEKERKNTLDYAMAAYGADANLAGISERAETAQKVNSKEMTGPAVGLSFKINQALSGGKDSLVRLPNGSQVEMDSRVAAVLSMPEEEKGSTMAGLFTGYVQEHDPGFLSAISAAGGENALSKDGELQFTRNEEEKLKKLWDKVVDAQKETMEFEAKPTDRLSPKEYEALGLDPSEARSRRLKEYGDPSESLGIIYSHPREHNGRPLPEPMIVAQRHMEKEEDGPSR